MKRARQPFGNLNDERWQCEAGCAAEIILILSWTAGDLEVELFFREIFPARRLSRETVLARAECQSASAGHRQTVVSFNGGTIRSDSEEAGGAAPHGAKLLSSWRAKHTEAGGPNPHCCVHLTGLLWLPQKLNNKTQLNTSNKLFHFLESISKLLRLWHKPNGFDLTEKQWSVFNNFILPGDDF